MEQSRLLIVAMTALWACGGDGTGPNPPPSAGSGVPANLLVAPSSGRVTLSWDPVSGATGYVLYWRNAPGVTPSNGSRVPATGAKVVEGRVTFEHVGRSDGPIYYVVTALTGGREGPASSEGAAVVNSNISILPTAPTPGLRIVDSVTVQTGAGSLFEIATLTASVGDRRVPLGFVDQGSSRQFWLGTLDLTGLATGAKRVVITVTDVRGDSAQASIPITFVGRATLRVDSPLPYTVARPTVRLTIHCQPITVGQCARIVVTDYYSGYQFVNVAASSVDQSLDLTSFPNGVRLVIDVTDDHQATVGRAIRDVFVEPSPALLEYATVPSRVLDLQPGLVLYADSAVDGSGEALKLRNLASGADVTLFAEPGALFPIGVVTASGGVVFEVDSHLGIPAHLYEWRNGSLTSLGSIYNTPSLQAAGDFVTWQADNLGAVLLRDVLAGTTTTVAATARQSGETQSSPSVAANGDVVYSTGGSVVRYRNGASTVLASSPTADTAYTSPATDGQSVIYLKLIGFSVPLPVVDYAVFTTAETTLARDSVGMPLGRSYFLNGGWVAYNRTGPSRIQQTWVRAPDGTATQVTFFSYPTVPEAIGPTGELVYGDGQHRYRAVSPYTAPAADVGYDHRPVLHGGGAVQYRGATAYVIIGRSVFTFAP